MKGLKAGIGVIIAAAAVVIAAMSLVVTYPNEYKLIRQFGEIVRVESEPGVSVKIPFLQTSASVPKALQIYDIPQSDVITRDKKSMIADAFVLWRISDPVLFTRHLNGQVAQAQSRISASVFSSMKAVISNMDQAEIIENRDGKLALDISSNIGDSLDEYGIQVLAVETKSLDMPDDNKQAVYDRMISERNNIAASYTAQGNSSAQKIKNDTTKEVAVMKSEASAQAEKIRAEGEAQYMQILSEAYNDARKAEFYNFVRSLDAAKASLQNGNNTLILDKSSPMAQIFYGY
ncbi:MAG TPA: protease modulator HflC [Candidatus Ventrimonas merdavium]|nr:protease modulator HflC [Candidatus Ventrimonas merdavium]